MIIMDLLEELKKRLKSFMEISADDEYLINYSLEKAKQSILNMTNQNKIPEGLNYVVIERAVCEFLAFKKGTGTLNIDSINLNAVVARITEGDITVQEGTNSLSPEARLDYLVSSLLRYGESEIYKYRRLVW